MMMNPPHPGELLREDVVLELGLSVTETAARLGMSRVALSRVLNGRAWLAMQVNYDLAQAKLHVQPPIRSLQPTQG